MRKQTRQLKVHFIGIGGIGLSALARWFKSENWRVSGCDILESQITKDLKREGVDIRYGHARSHIKGRNLVIVSQAIRKTEPEYRAAGKARIPILPRPAALGELTRLYDTIAIAGAHGKSTTTAMAALALIRAKLDPTVIVGTKLKEFPKFNFRKGRSRWFVLEADEYGRAFLEYSPLHAIVTNVDREHLDTYKNLTGVKNAFLKFMKNVRAGGSLILNGDDPVLMSLRSPIAALAKKHRLNLRWYSTRGASAARIKKLLRVPGDHNVSNAMAVLTLATKVLKIPSKTALAALQNFHGTWRRSEYRGSFKLQASSFKLFDDYAHHPTEIRATLRAFREKFPKAALVCVFQPHQAERLKRLFKDFRTAFEDADALLIFPEYHVAGRERNHELGIRNYRYSARALALSIKKKYPKQIVQYVEKPKKFNRAYLAKTLSPIPPFLKEVPRRGGGFARKTGMTKNFIVIMMGAGDIVEYTNKLIA